MAARSFGGLELSGQDPLLESGIAYAEGCGSFARFQEKVYIGHVVTPCFPLYVGRFKRCPTCWMMQGYTRKAGGSECIVERMKIPY